MKGERLFRILGLVDEDLIEEAFPSPVQRRRKSPWGRYVTAAACLTAVCGLSFFWLVTGGFQGMGSASPMDTAGSEASGGTADSSGGSGHDGGTAFMSYAGPVFPLTTAEDAAGLTASRKTTWDFSPGTYEDGAPRQWGARVTDAYTLTNSTDEDVTITALYPFAGSFSALAEIQPELSADGAAIDAALCAGAYAGGFQGVYGDDGMDSSTWNLKMPDSWKDYQALLEDGRYLSSAREDMPAPDIPVTVYEFSDFKAPAEEYDAATQAIAFTIAPEATTILSYGFNGMSWDEETGWRQYDYFVPDGMRRESDTKMLIVLGDDIRDYSLQGYANGACEEEIEGVSCTVARREVTLGQALDQLVEAYAEQYDQNRAPGQPSVFDETPLHLFQTAVAEMMVQYGLLSDAPADRYGDGRLDDLLSEALSVHRVLYGSFEITVPANSSVSVTATLWKAPSFNFACSQSENEGLQGYDLVTQLGSSLVFTSQTAALVHTDSIELARQNLGFDLAAGITEVPLDTAEAHYYLEIRPLADT